MPPEDAKELRSVEIFHGLADGVVDRVARACNVQTFAPDAKLFWQGAKISGLHVILSGWVELSAYYNSAQYTTLIAGAGDALPVGNLGGDQPSLITARTVSRSRIVLVPWTRLQPLLDSEPTLVAALLRATLTMGEKLVRELNSRITSRPHERLAAWIYHQVADGPDERSFTLPYHKKLLAASLGMSLATLSRDIEALQPYGVSIDNRTVHVRSVSVLKPLVDHALPSEPGAGGDRRPSSAIERFR